MSETTKRYINTCAITNLETFDNIHWDKFDDDEGFVKTDALVSIPVKDLATMVFLTREDVENWAPEYLALLGIGATVSELSRLHNLALSSETWGVEALFRMNVQLIGVHPSNRN